MTPQWLHQHVWISKDSSHTLPHIWSELFLCISAHVRVCVCVCVCVRVRQYALSHSNSEREREAAFGQHGRTPIVKTSQFFHTEGLLSWNERQCRDWAGGQSVFRRQYSHSDAHASFLRKTLLDTAHQTLCVLARRSVYAASREGGLMWEQNILCVSSYLLWC